VQVGGGGDWKEKWCRFEYEYLPAFCYNCGIIGHVDKNCAMQLKSGEEQQYGSWLKCNIHKKSSQSWDRGPRGSGCSFESRMPSFFNSTCSGSRKRQPIMVKGQ
jgi:hypothetical protein